MTRRQKVYQKYGGRCAYTGKQLHDDWQIDHVEAVRRNWWTNSAMFPENHNIENMLPAQKIVNHYKHSMGLEDFRRFMMGFHLRLARHPKNPKTEKSAKRKAYMMELARLFDITPDKPFSCKFYFETI